MYKKIHPKFKLNSTSYQFSELKALANKYYEEGKFYEKTIGHFLLQWLDDKPTIEVKTSGSTGTPKTCVLKKQHMINSALATGDFFNLKPKNTALLCLPVDYIAGKMMIVRAIVLGLALDFVKPTTNPLAGIYKDYDFVAMVPIQLEESLDEINRIKILIVGGIAISKKLQKKVQKKRTAIFETYGMTETITHVAVKRVNPTQLFPLTAIKTGSTKSFYNNSALQNEASFKALPNVVFAKDDRGCLVISAPKISDDKVVTNDCVKLLSNTEFQWLGRYDSIINSGGIKLFPEQIEIKLKPFIKNRFFVAGIPDSKLGHKLVLIVEGEVNPEKLLAEIKNSGKLGKFEIPKLIYVLSKFLETETGKIRRKKNIEALDL